MQPITFSLTDANGVQTNFGTLLKSKSVTKIALVDDIDGKSIIEMDTVDIKDNANFIASVIRRMDRDGLYDTVTITDTNITVPIIREDVDDNVMTIFVRNNKEGFVATKEPMIEIPLVHGGTEQVSVTELGFKPITVPRDFKYVKNPVLNALYKEAMIPANYKKTLSKSITKEVNKRRGTAKWAFSVAANSPQSIYGPKFTTKHGMIEINSKKINKLEKKFGIKL